MTEPAERLREALTDRYRIERELGRGGMAIVYLARDLRHQRDVAVKVLRPDLAATLGPERFLREIRTTAGLHHPHILQLYDSGEAAGFLYYVMPYVAGESLRDRLTREKQLRIEDALQIAREVADALGFAHQRDIVHRDVKPENILLASGHALVADFGIARAVSEAMEPLTQTGVTVGTPQYMSPEQAAGTRELDGRSDLYSLGCVLYEMLGGQPPFTGPTPQAVIRQHVVAEAPPITNLRATVPAEVAGALARTLAKDPADRVSSAAELVQALTTTATSSPARARPAGPARTLVRLTVLAVLALVGIAAARWLGRSAAAPAPTNRIERIAVLPLENATGDSGQAFFADGMTRELIGVLTTAGVRVLGHRAVARYRGRDLAAARVAKELGVDAIVSGSVIRSGEVVQVAMELIDPATGENLWAATVTKPATDVVTLQREVAGEIARGIRARLTPEQQRDLGAAPQVHPEAYAEYLLGQEQLLRWTEDGFRQSVEHLERAVARDSSFALAWAALARTYGHALFYAWVPKPVARARVVQAAERALALDPRLGDAYVSRGMVRLYTEWDFAAAETDLRRGIELNPSGWALDQIGVYFWSRGDFPLAIDVIDRAIDVEPSTAQWHSDRGWFHWSAGDTGTARAAALRAVALDPTFFESHHELAWLEKTAGNLDRARDELTRAMILAGGDYSWRPILDGFIRVAARDSAGARALLRELDRDTRYAQRAALLFVLGDKDSAYTLLDRAVATRDVDALVVVPAIPELYPFHGEPRYQRLRERMGLKK